MIWMSKHRIRRDGSQYGFVRFDVDCQEENREATDRSVNHTCGLFPLTLYQTMTSSVDRLPEITGQYKWSIRSWVTTEHAELVL